MASTITFHVIHNKIGAETLDIIMNQESYWNKVAGEKEFSTPFQINVFEKYVSKKSKILDVGCGYGRTLNELHVGGFVVTSNCYSGKVHRD